jgi:hypothetical protein
MSAPIPLRRDFEASQLRGLARRTKDGPQARRLLALAAIYDGARRSEAAKIGGVGRPIVMSTRLVVPANITIILLPPKCPSLTPSKTSGSSCAKTGSRTACSNHTTISSTIAARPGTGSSISPGASCP